MTIINLYDLTFQTLNNWLFVFFNFIIYDCEFNAHPFVQFFTFGSYKHNFFLIFGSNVLISLF